MLAELVSLNTVNDPIRGVKPPREAAEVIREWLRENSVDAYILEVNGYYTVYGFTGKEPHLMFIAHFDTVPVVHRNWIYDPFRLTIVGDKAYGRGALDDKSNVASIMIALRELAQREIPVYYAFTGDEEIGGRNGALVIADKIRARKYR